jgi:hypothetical protein
VILYNDGAGNHRFNHHFTLKMEAARYPTSLPDVTTNREVIISRRENLKSHIMRVLSVNITFIVGVCFINFIGTKSP